MNFNDFEQYSTVNFTSKPFYEEKIIIKKDYYKGERLLTEKEKEDIFFSKYKKTDCDQTKLIELYKHKIINLQKENLVTMRGIKICSKCNKSIGAGEYVFNNFIISSNYLHYIEHHNFKFDDVLVDYLLYDKIPDKITSIGILTLRGVRVKIDKKYDNNEYLYRIKK